MIASETLEVWGAAGIQSPVVVTEDLSGHAMLLHKPAWAENSAYFPI